MGHFLAWRAGTNSWYSTGESAPIKAGQMGIIPHLGTACEIHHIYEDLNESSSARPERSQQLEIPPSLHSKQAACFSGSAGFSMAAGISPGAEISTSARILPSVCFSLAAGIYSSARILGSAMIFTSAMILPSAIIFWIRNIFNGRHLFYLRCIFVSISQGYFLDHLPHFCQMCANIQSNAIVLSL